MNSANLPYPHHLVPQGESGNCSLVIVQKLDSFPKLVRILGIEHTSFWPTSVGQECDCVRVCTDENS